jgi:type I restriction enzyme S subunit
MIDVRPLKRVAMIRSSNVDKIIIDGEQVVRLCNYVDVYYNERITDQIAFSSGSADTREIRKFELRSGDVLITKDSETPNDIAVPALVEPSADGIVCGYHLAMLRPDRTTMRGDFLFWCLKAQAVKDAFSIRAQGITRFGLTLNAIGSVPVPSPDLNTQKAIAKFLDRETARIDRLMARKERFLSLIAEKRSALIERAIDGSLLHGRSRTGPTGWFGQLPNNWSVKRARYLFRERLELSESGGEELLTVSHITGVTARSEKDVNMFLAETLEGYKLVQPGDLVVNTMWAWMGAMGVSRIAGCASPSYGVYRPLDDLLDHQFLDLIVRSAPFVAEVNRRSKGVWASRLRLYPDAFLDILMPVPPLQEQRRVLAALSAAIGRQEEVAKLSIRSIELLKERRAALITAAVTGQIDVRGQAINITTGPDRARFRVIVGSEIADRHRGNPKFGRVKNQKLLFLAEAHVGISELQGNYLREAAGPFDRTLIEETERGMEAAGFFHTNAPDGGNGGVTYTPLAKAGQHRDELVSLLGPRADALSRLIDLLKDFDSRAVEAIATLYAVWNDALMDSETPDDDAIVRAVLNDWHPEKRDKFKDADLHHWLSWMKRNGLVPSGKGPRTISTTPRDMFA